MIHTKQVIKLFEDFSIFMGFLNFEHTQKQNMKKIRSITTSKIKTCKRNTCFKQKVMHDKMHEPMILSIGSIDA